MDFSEFLKSRTVWTNVLSIASVLLIKFGIDLSPEQQADILTAIMTLASTATLFFKATPKQ